MGQLITDNPNALRFLMNEDLYDLKSEAGGRKAEVGSRKSEVGGLRSEGGGVKSDVVVPGLVTGEYQEVKAEGAENKVEVVENAELKAQIGGLEANDNQQLAENKVQAQQPLDFSYLGENNRYFLVLVDDVTHNELNAPHKDLLLKIMVAKKLELRDLAILNLAKYPDATFSQLKEFFSCNKVVLFGIDPQRIGLSAIGANKVERYDDVKLLAAFGLEEMRTNTDKKREFWNVMKDF